MAAKRFSLARARVLLSNDDGLNAPGLKLLEKVLASLVREVWVVAPETEQSATSHSLTLRRPLRIRHVSEHRFTIDGTPTDSVLMGINELMKDHPPDLVISGINRGGNVGEDVTYSGTVAAAMEGTLLGVPSIALSQVCADGHPVKWATAEKWAPKVLKTLCKGLWPAGVLVNVNFPDVMAGRVTGIEVTRQGRRKIGSDLVSGVDPRGEPYYWIGAQRREQDYRSGSDLEAILRGAVSVTPLTMDLTHAPTLKKLRDRFA
ncbi:MAG: 5'/3'-nucleotidase SurE [Rhodospirillales bacterium]|nr:5'/3'-nucleotidase SurE [Alphaproteobacteria bacterium]MBL6948952.1 5'/3'-nucleotidase SurE [Rhodospirillales bacterium]